MAFHLFATLSSSLLALTQAVRTCPKDPLSSLTVLPFGGICNKNTLLGKCGTLYHQVSLQNPQANLEQTIHTVLTDLFNQAVSFAYDARQFRIQDTLWELNSRLEKHSKLIDSKKQQTRYEDYLKMELKGSIESPDAYLKDFNQKTAERKEREKIDSRHLLINFSQSTDFFWLAVKKEQIGSYSFSEIIQPFVAKANKVCLLDRPLFKALKKERDWVLLEGFLEQSIPITCLAKLTGPVPLTREEKECLNNWIIALNGCQKLTSRQLFHVLTEIVSICQIQGSSSLTLSDLLVWLDKEKCPHLYKDDDPHLDWREALVPGSKIKCNGKELILGEQLSPKKEVGQRDFYKIFALQEHPDKVVKIACNRFLLFLEAAQSTNESSHWGIECVERDKEFGLDPQGRCVVLERLTSLFEGGSSWKSNAIELNREEEQLALIFANHLTFFLTTNTFVCNLSFSHLMRDTQGKLKTTRLLKKEKGNYQGWEHYCLNVANKNEHVLNFLVNTSGLHETHMARYYREVVKETLETGKISLIGKPLPKEHRDQGEALCVENVCKEAQSLRQECLETIIGKLRVKNCYSHTNKEDVEQKMIPSLLAVYQRMPTSAYFSDTFKQSVINDYFSLIPEEVEAKKPRYYEKQREVLTQYNQQADST